MYGFSILLQFSNMLMPSEASRQDVQISNAMLLSLYEAVSLNRNFITVLTHVCMYVCMYVYKPLGPVKLYFLTNSESSGCGYHEIRRLLSIWCAFDGYSPGMHMHMLGSFYYHIWPKNSIMVSYNTLCWL